MDLPLPVWTVSPCAWGLGPRRAGAHLAMMVRVVWPSALLYSVSALDFQDFAAVSPVNASLPPSRASTHDSGPSWAATPSTYDTFASIHRFSRRAENFSSRLPSLLHSSLSQPVSPRQGIALWRRVGRGLCADLDGSKAQPPSNSGRRERRVSKP